MIDPDDPFTQRLPGHKHEGDRAWSGSARSGCSIFIAAEGNVTIRPEDPQEGPDKDIQATMTATFALLAALLD